MGGVQYSRESNMSAHQAAWEVAAVFCRRVSLLSLGKCAPSMVCSPGMCPHPA